MPFPHTQPHATNALHRANATPFLGVVTHITHTLGTHARHATTQDTHTYIHKAHATGVTYRTHATPLRHTILGSYITHAACTSQPTHPVHRTTHIHTQPRSSPLALQPSQVLCPVRLILSCRHTDRSVLAGSETVNRNALPCCLLLGVRARILSSFAHPEAPFWCLSLTSLPPSPTLEAIPCSISSEASRDKAGVP